VFDVTGKYVGSEKITEMKSVHRILLTFTAHPSNPSEIKRSRLEFYLWVMLEYTAERDRNDI